MYSSLSCGVDTRVHCSVRGWQTLPDAQYEGGNQLPDTLTRMGAQGEPNDRETGTFFIASQIPLCTRVYREPRSCQTHLGDRFGSRLVVGWHVNRCWRSLAGARQTGLGSYPDGCYPDGGSYPVSVEISWVQVSGRGPPNGVGLLPGFRLEPGIDGEILGSKQLPGNCQIIGTSVESRDLAIPGERATGVGVESGRSDYSRGPPL